MKRSTLSESVKRLLLLLVLSWTLALPAVSDVKLPHVIADHMVLQRDKPVPIWGWADPGEAVSVTLGDHTLKTVADEAGQWLVKLPAQNAGGPHQLVVVGKNTIQVNDVFVGEVWLCSGQSNMEMGVG
ncbi:MAG: 9-O-acetylesterase, partial [Planctomycetes bacterium]|nr:9-O-acetylesterase [Planctomycetota bacterium]